MAKKKGGSSASWIPMTDDALAARERMRTLVQPPPHLCPACFGLDGEHQERCEVQVHRAATEAIERQALYAKYNEESKTALAVTDETALSYAVAWGDPFDPDAMHWRDVALAVWYSTGSIPTLVE